jgi:hypothetical protein
MQAMARPPPYFSCRPLMDKFTDTPAPSPSQSDEPATSPPSAPGDNTTGTAWFPEVTIDDPNPSEWLLTRRGVLESKRSYSERRAAAFQECRGMAPSPEKSALYKEIQVCTENADELEQRLDNTFVPQHGPTQFLSPRAFFQSPLFSASNHSIERAGNVELDLALSQGKPYIRYSGPELRQSDARVFLALLHMLRDVKVGTRVVMQPESVCVAIFGRYDGNSRRQLRTYIQRLQKGLIITDKYSVQLCLGFEYPTQGGWSVALDRHIVELFRVSPKAWLSIERRLSLPEGLTTWLYAFIESQTRLIPMNIARLRTLCGSDSGERAFSNSLRLALKEVAQAGIIDTGWSLRRGQVRWMKKSPSGAPP